MSGCGGGCGVGGWDGPLPGDPSNDLVLSAVGVYRGIQLTWSYPTTNPFAVSYVKVFRGSSPSFGSAMKIADWAGSGYFDSIPTITTYYYWIQVVSINGTTLATIGPASATSKLGIQETIDELTGIIDRGLLATTLKNELDQISILNANLLNEVFDRENGETSLASAIADVAAGVAEAHTFILDERNSRTTQNSAIVEQINGVVATLGGDIAAVTTSMTASIDELTGTVGAMYVAKLTVNNLIGGFGLYNNGSVVEAGFDVDRFWIGRTSADKRKPFIISGGVAYLDTAAILDASITTAKIGSLAVDTLKIANDAVSVLSTSRQILTGTAGSTTLSFYMPYAGSYAVQIWCYLFGDTPVSGSATSEVWATTTEGRSYSWSAPFSGSVVNMLPRMMTLSDNVGVGNHTITVNYAYTGLPGGTFGVDFSFMLMRRYK